MAQPSEANLQLLYASHSGSSRELHGPRQLRCEGHISRFQHHSKSRCSTQRSPVEHLGKLLMYSIRPVATDLPKYPDLGPVEAVKTFLTLLEHFYQVPNAGECVSLSLGAPSMAIDMVFYDSRCSLLGSLSSKT
jgi:hypothetical protein